MLKAFENQEIVNAGDIDLQHIFCPDCGSEKNIVLSGFAVMPRQEVFTEHDIEFEMDRSNITFDPRRLDCQSCKKTFTIWDKSLYESQQTVAFLAKYIKDKLGEDLLKKGIVN